MDDVEALFANFRQQAQRRMPPSKAEIVSRARRIRAHRRRRAVVAPAVVFAGLGLSVAAMAGGSAPDAVRPAGRPAGSSHPCPTGYVTTTVIIDPEAYARFLATSVPSTVSPSPPSTAPACPPATVPDQPTTTTVVVTPPPTQAPTTPGPSATTTTVPGVPRPTSTVPAPPPGPLPPATTTTVTVPPTGPPVSTTAPSPPFPFPSTTAPPAH